MLVADGTNEKILMKGLRNDMWAGLQVKILKGRRTQELGAAGSHYTLEAEGI